MIRKSLILVGQGVLLALVSLLFWATLCEARVTKTYTGTGAVSVSLDSELTSGHWAVEQLALHTNPAGGAGSLTVTVDSAAGAAYDTLVYTKSMVGVTDVVWRAVPYNDSPLILKAGDKLAVAWANAGGATWGLTITWRKAD